MPGRTFVKHPNFYVHCPARTDPSVAADGLDSIMVLLPVANMQEMLSMKQSSCGSMQGVFMPNARLAVMEWEYFLKPVPILQLLVVFPA